MNHDTLRKTAAVLCMGLALTTVVAGQKGGKQVDTPVTSTLNIAGSIGSETNYRVQGDGNGPYTTFSIRRPADEVVSILQTSNTCCQDWELSALNSTTRGILFDFRDEVSPGTGNAPFDWSVTPGRILVQCHLAGVNFPAMTNGQTALCPVVLNLSSGPTTYRISLGHSGQPGTDMARVTCSSANVQNQCNRWDIAPDAVHDGELKNVGRLLIVGKNGDLTPAGDFYFTFSFRVTRP